MRERTLPASLLLPLAGLVLTTGLTAQDPQRTIQVSIADAAKDTIYLANYYGNKPDVPDDHDQPGNDGHPRRPGLVCDSLGKMRENGFVAGT